MNSAYIYVFTDTTISEIKNIKNETTISTLTNIIKVKDNKIDNNQDTIFDLTDEDLENIKNYNKNKISATAYIEDLGDDTRYHILDLKDTISELEGYLSMFDYSPNQSLLEKISFCFRKYSSSISILIEFNDLANALSILSTTLLKIDITNINHKKLMLYLYSILSDLLSWISNIFDNKTAVDIHYLDTSFFNDCLGVELEFLNRENNNLDNDIELF
jgi:hypothetical protein